jgi:hypothetical protein
MFYSGFTRYIGNGKMIITRILRYSMDGLALSHVGTITVPD